MSKLITLGALTVVLAAGCIPPWEDGIDGSGDVVTETREVGGFTSVELDGEGELIITQGDTELLSIESDDNILPVIESTVENGTLRLDVENGKSIKNFTRLVYTLTVTNLNSISMDGAASIRVENFTTDALAVSMDGAGEFVISGMATSQTISFDGASSYDGRDFATAQTTVRIDGAGDVTVRVSDMLDVEIDGTGDVVYLGDPEVTQSIDGTGSVEQGSE